MASVNILTIDISQALEGKPILTESQRHFWPIGLSGNGLQAALEWTSWPPFQGRRVTLVE